jgi:hypothetical protein
MEKLVSGPLLMEATPLGRAAAPDGPADGGTWWSWYWFLEEALMKMWKLLQVSSLLVVSFVRCPG